MPENQDGFFSKLKLWYRAFYNDNQVPYRLVEFIEKDHQKFAVIALRHSRYSFTLPLQKAARDDGLLAGLCVQDMRNLTMYAAFCLLRHRYEYVSVEFSGDDDVNVTIRDMHTQTELTMTDKELMECKSIINKFKRDDLFKLGYICGSYAPDED